MLPEKRKNQHIQGARGLFSLSVFFYHVHHSGLATWPIFESEAAKFALGSLQYGVELFFGISGIVILPSIARSSSLLNFAAERLSRLYPVLWATIAAVSLSALLAHTRFPPAWMVVASLVIVPPMIKIQHVNPIAWSLDYEVTFYALCAVYWKGGSSLLVRAIVLLLGAAFVLCFPRGMMFVGGILIATGWLNARVSRPVYPTVMLFAFLGSWQGIAYMCGREVNNIDVFAGTPLHGALLACCVLVSVATGTLALLGIARGEGLIGRFLFTGPMVAMGSISYSFYLWHIPVMAGVKQVILHLHMGGRDYSQILFLILSLPLALAVAYASYRVIELGFTKHLRDWLAISKGRRETVLRADVHG